MRSETEWNQFPINVKRVSNAVWKFPNRFSRLLKKKKVSQWSVLKLEEVSKCKNKLFMLEGEQTKRFSDCHQWRFSKIRRKVFHVKNRLLTKINIKIIFCSPDGIISAVESYGHIFLWWRAIFYRIGWKNVKKFHSWKATTSRKQRRKTQFCVEMSENCYDTDMDVNVG